MRLPNRATGLLASQQNRNGILSRLLQLPRQRRASRKARTERQFAKSFQSMSCSVRGDRRTLVRGSSDQFSQEYTAAQLFNEILLQFTAAILCQVSILTGNGASEAKRKGKNSRLLGRARAAAAELSVICIETPVPPPQPVRLYLQSCSSSRSFQVNKPFPFLSLFPLSRMLACALKITRGSELESRPWTDAGFSSQEEPESRAKSEETRIRMKFRRRCSREKTERKPWLSPRESTPPAN